MAVLHVALLAASFVVVHPAHRLARHGIADLCAGIEFHINEHDREGVSFEIIEHLESIVATLQQSPPSCDPYLTLRALWARATTMERFALDRQETNPAIARAWFAKAATAYRELLDWVTRLNRQSIERVLIGTIGIAQVDSANYEPLFLRFVRGRPRQSLFGLVNSLAASRNFDQLFDDLERFAQDLPESLSDKTLQHWLKWLRAQDDFRRGRTDNEIRTMLGECDSCRQRWTTFVSFMASGSSATGEPRRVARKVRSWLN